MQFPWNVRRVALYRHYDASGTLLYVGITGKPVQRLGQHRHASEWTHLAVRMDTEWFSSASDAAIAELHAIANEKPLYNKPLPVGPQNPRAEPTVMLSARIPQTLMERLDRACEAGGIKKSDFIRDLLEKSLNGS